MISHRLTLEEGPDTFNELINPDSEETFGKVIFEPNK